MSRLQAVDERRPSPSDPADQSRWYAFYTRARHEKRVAESLRAERLETYLPLIPRERQWHDRKKIVHWPMFDGYVFVRTPLSEFHRAYRIPGVVRAVTFNGRPTPIPSRDIENVRRLVEVLATGGLHPEPEPMFEIGESVRVVSGPLAGIEGRVAQHRNDRVLVMVGLVTIGQGVKVEVDARALAPLSDEVEESDERPVTRLRVAPHRR